MPDERWRCLKLCLSHLQCHPFKIAGETVILLQVRYRYVNLVANFSLRVQSLQFLLFTESVYSEVAGSLVDKRGSWVKC